MEEKTWYDTHKEESTIGNRLADSVAKGMGSWRFIIVQTLIVIVWMTLNVTALINHWDVYPFILLNLLFSTQAAYAAPIIMMSQNRQSERDRAKADHNYRINLRSKIQLEELNELHQHQKRELNEIGRTLKLIVKKLEQK